MLDKRLEIAFKAAKIISEKLSGISGIDIDFCIYGTKINLPRNKSNVRNIIAGKIIDPNCIGYWREYYSSNNGPVVEVNVTDKDDVDAASKLAEELIEEIKEILEVKPERDEKIIAEIAKSIKNLSYYAGPSFHSCKLAVKNNELRMFAKNAAIKLIERFPIDEIATDAQLPEEKVKEQLPFLKPSDLNF